MTTATLSPLGLGCARIGSFNNPQSMAEARALIAAALELGVTTIDTSNIYGQGDSEAQIGHAIAGQRDRAFVVTKTGKGFSAKMRLLRPLKPLLRPLLAARRKSASDPVNASAVTARREGELRENWDPASFTSSLDASLRRLRSDRVDGFLLHSPPAAVAADPAVGAALAALKQAGKVRHYGVSVDDIACFEASLGMDGLSILQLPWDVIVAVRGTAAEAQVRARGIIVLAREVIRLQPGIAPVAAVRASIAEPMVSCALVGTTSRAHLAQLAEGVRA